MPPRVNRAEKRSGDNDTVSTPQKRSKVAKGVSETAKPSQDVPLTTHSNSSSDVDSEITTAPSSPLPDGTPEKLIGILPTSSNTTGGAEGDGACPAPIPSPPLATIPVLPALPAPASMTVVSPAASGIPSSTNGTSNDANKASVVVTQSTLAEGEATTKAKSDMKVVPHVVQWDINRYSIRIEDFRHSKSPDEASRIGKALTLPNAVQFHPTNLQWGPRRGGHDDLFKVLVDENLNPVHVTFFGHAKVLSFKYGDKNKALCSAKLQPLCEIQTAATWNLLNSLSVNCERRSGEIIWASTLLADRDVGFRNIRDSRYDPVDASERSLPRMKPEDLKLNDIILIRATIHRSTPAKRGEKDNSSNGNSRGSGSRGSYNNRRGNSSRWTAKRDPDELDVKRYRAFYHMESLVLLNNARPDDSDCE